MKASKRGLFLLAELLEMETASEIEADLETETEREEQL